MKGFRLKALTTRLTLLALGVALAFTLLAGLALEQAFDEASRLALAERLRGQLYLLMAEAEVDARGRLHMPPQLPVAELEIPGSGNYAWILDAEGAPLWRSRSLQGTDLAPPTVTGTPDGLRQHAGHFFLAQEVRWEHPGGEIPLRFLVASSAAPWLTQRQAFRTTLFRHLGLMAVLLALGLGMGLWLGLAPLRRAARQVAEIEHGRRERLSGPWPAELEVLAHRINRLIEHQQRQQERYRNALGDLAHSLKTPLAVLRGIAEESAREDLREQTRRMDEIIQYQLARAAQAGRALQQRRTPLRPAAERIVRTLRQVGHDAPARFHIDIDETLAVQLDEGDLLELLGNLLDNAAKWAESEVTVRARETEHGVAVEVEDDGPGIPEAARHRLLQRGQRLDERTPGQGIGLAVVAEIVHAAGGRLEIARGQTLGGALLRVTLPGGPLRRHGRE